MEENKVKAPDKKSLIVCGVLLLSAVNAFWMLSKKTLDSHECFVSVTAREMFQSGDWIFPTCNGQPRLNKTPLSYWLVAGLAKITGTVDEFIARLPSAIFAFLSAAAILYFVNQWLSFRIAAISTSVWITTLGYMRSSHSARPDMALAFFVMLCFLCFYSAITTQNRRPQVIYMLVFWISLGLGMLAKGPAPLPYVFVPLLFYIVLERKWKIVSKLLPLIGIMIFLAIVLPWPLAIAYKVKWVLLIWKLEFFDRFFGDYAPGDYPTYYYLLIMFKFITPWFAFLPIALFTPFYKVWNKKQPVVKFLWLWFVVGIAFLTVNGGKRQHYILPLMSAMAVLIGIVLEDMVFVRKAYALKFAKNVLLGHTIAIIAVAAAGVVYVYEKAPYALGNTAIVGALAVVIVTAVVLLFAKGKPAIACGVGFAGLVVWIMISYASFVVILDVDKYSRDFAKKIAGIVPPSGRLVAYQNVSSRFVQYYGKIVPEINDKSELTRHYEQGEWVICISRYLKDLNRDKQFRAVCSETVIAGEEKEDAGGVLFHKTAPVVESDN